MFDFSNLVQNNGPQGQQAPTQLPWMPSGMPDPRILQASYDPSQNGASPQQSMQQPSDLQHIADVFGQLVQNKQDQQSGNNFLTQILSNRMQPDSQDTSRSLLNSAVTNSYSSPEQEMAGRYQAQLSPYSDAIGLQEKMAQTGLQTAQAGYYNSALQRDLAEKAYQYANDPQMAQSRMMAQYMASLSGVPMPQQQLAGQQQQISPSNGMIPDSSAALQEYRQQNGMATPPIDAQMAAQGRPIGTSAPMNGQLPIPPTPQTLPQQLQANAQQRQGGGFNPMGAMLAKSLGLTDMQIGPNGQPMPIPGSMKIENGQVISFGPNGIPTSATPKSPTAQNAIENSINLLSQKLDEYKNSGSAISEGQSAGENITNKVLSSPILQSVQQGTKAQSLRSEMASIIMQTMPDYMQAKGLTPGMERTVQGQEMILKAIGVDPGQSDEANRAVLANLSKIAGTGNYAATQSIPVFSGPDDPAFQQLPSGSQFKTQDGRPMVKH